MIVQTYKSLVDGCLMESCATNLKQMYCATLSLISHFISIQLLTPSACLGYFFSSISETHMSLYYNFCIRIFIVYKIYNIHHHPFKYKKIINYVLKMKHVCIKLELMDLKVVYTRNGKPFKGLKIHIFAKIIRARIQVYHNKSKIAHTSEELMAQGYESQLFSRYLLLYTIIK